MRVETRIALHLDTPEQFHVTRNGDTFRVRLIHMVPDAEGGISVVTLYGARVTKNGRIAANATPMVGRGDTWKDEVPASIVQVMMLFASLPNAGTIPINEG